MKKLIVGSLLGFVVAAFILTVTGYIDLKEAYAQARGAAMDLVTLIAGERNPNSATNGYLVVRNEANASVISKTTAVTIGSGVAGDTHLIGLHITTALTGTCTIAGFPDSDGAAQTITLPIGSVGFKDFRGAINSAGALIITCGTAGDDNFVTVLWRPV